MPLTTRTANRPIEAGRSLARLARPQNTVYSVVLTGLVAFISGSDAIKAIVAAAAVYCVLVFATLINNTVDVETDRLNRRQRDNPIVDGLIDINQARFAAGVFAAILALLQSWLVQPASAYICFLYCVLAAAYSLPPLKLQSRGWLAPISLAVCYTGLPIWLAASQVHTMSVLTFQLIGLEICLLVSTLLAKDYKDLRGDKAVGKRTPLVRYGAGLVQKAAYSFLGVGFVFCFLLDLGWQRRIIILALALVFSVGCVYLHIRQGRLNLNLSVLLRLVLLSIAVLTVS